MASSSRKPTRGQPRNSSGRAARGALGGSTGVLVLGMHRSGTSVIARGLKTLGVYLGDALLDPQPDNPKGYWEHGEILATNEEVMAKLDCSWSDSHPMPAETWESSDLDELKERAASLLVDLFRGRRLWGFKDPRTIRLFPFWREVLQRLGPSVSIVLAIRPPQSAIGSLVARDGMPTTDAEELWLEYMLPWLREIATYPVVIVDYDRLIRSPLRELRRMAKHLGVEIDPTDPEITEFTRSFVDRDLRHHVEPAAAQTLADETYRALLKLTSSRASWRRSLELTRRYQTETLGQPPSKTDAGESGGRSTAPAASRGQGGQTAR